MRFSPASPAALRAALLAIAAATALLFAVPAGASAAPFKFGMQDNGNVLIQGNPAATRAAIENLDAAGVQVVRVSLSWKLVATNAAHCQTQTAAQLGDPDNACYDWSMYDAVMTRSRELGMEVLATVYQVPAWVHGNDDKAYVGASEAQFAKTVSLWSAFTKAAGERYSPFSAYGPVKYWTLINEPNSNVFWKPQNSAVPTRFARLFVAAAKALRSSNGSAQIAPGPIGPKGRSQGTGMYPTQFMTIALPELARLKAGPYINAWAHNPYPGSKLGPRVGPLGTGVLRTHNMQELFTLLDAYKVTKKKPVWATEFSYETNPPDFHGISQAKQAMYLADTYQLLHATKRVTLAFWYVYRDNEIDDDWQSGLVDPNGYKKPSYGMYQRPVTATVQVVMGKGKARRVVTRVVGGAKTLGTRVELWGASLTGGSSPKLAISYNGKTYKTVGTKRSGKVLTAKIKAKKTFYVRVQDSLGNGPARKFVVA